MKNGVYIIAVILMVSCRTTSELSRSTVEEKRTHQTTQVMDTSKVVTGTSINIHGKKQENTSSYSKQTNFGKDSSVVSIIETWTNINLQVDFSGLFDEIKKEDFKYIATTITSDTTKINVDEQLNQGSDSRMIQGGEWGWIMLAIGIIIIGIFTYIRIWV